MLLSDGVMSLCYHFDIRFQLTLLVEILAFSESMLTSRFKNIFVLLYDNHFHDTASLDVQGLNITLYGFPGLPFVMPIPIM